jgi:hypothetical protein
MFFINLGKSIYKGFQKAYQTPTLPDHIIKFKMDPTIRIFRVLGGLSFLFIITKVHLNFPIYFLFIAAFFNILFSIYHFYLSYHRIKHIRFLFKSGALEIRK